MGFGRNPGRAAAQHFSEEEIAQLVKWYHDGAAKIINKVKGKGAAAALIKMKLHDPGDEDIKQFQDKYAQRISAWFSSYTRVLTKRREQAERAGRAEKAGEGMLTEDEAKAAANAAAKKDKGPPRKKPKRAGASGSGVAGPAATVAGMTSAPTAATHVTPSTKKRKAPAKPTAQLSGAPDSGAAVLPLPAPMRVDADEMMPSTQAPQKAPTPSRKKAKLMAEESGGAADVTAPMSAALVVVDDATAPDVRSDDAVPTGRTRRHNAGKHRNTARLHAAAGHLDIEQPGESVRLQGDVSEGDRPRKDVDSQDHTPRSLPKAVARVGERLHAATKRDEHHRSPATPHLRRRRPSEVRRTPTRAAAGRRTRGGRT